MKKRKLFKGINNDRFLYDLNSFADILYDKQLKHALTTIIYGKLKNKIDHDFDLEVESLLAQGSLNEET